MLLNFILFYFLNKITLLRIYVLFMTSLTPSQNEIIIDDLFERLQTEMIIKRYIEVFMLWKQFQGHIHFRCIGLSKEYGALPLVEYVVVFLNIGKLYMNFKPEIELMQSQSILTYKWKYTFFFFH